MVNVCKHLTKTKLFRKAKNERKLSCLYSFLVYDVQFLFVVQLLQNDVLAHEASIENVTEAGRQVIVSEAGANASDIRQKLDELRTHWEDLHAKMREYQLKLENALKEVFTTCELMESFVFYLKFFPRIEM